MTSSSPAIEAAALTRRFDQHVAVDAVDLRIDGGVFCGLIGSNGAGKTTLIKMLTTLLPPTAGTARVGGFDVVRAPRQVRRRIGYVPQMISADAALTGRENLALFAKLYAIPRSDCRARRPAGQGSPWGAVADLAHIVLKAESCSIASSPSPPSSSITPSAPRSSSATASTSVAAVS